MSIIIILIIIITTTTTQSNNIDYNRYYYCWTSQMLLIEFSNQFGESNFKCENLNDHNIVSIPIGFCACYTGKCVIYCQCACTAVQHVQLHEFSCSSVFYWS